MRHTICRGFLMSRLVTFAVNFDLESWFVGFGCHKCSDCVAVHLVLGPLDFGLSFAKRN